MECESVTSRAGSRWPRTWCPGAGPAAAGAPIRQSAAVFSPSD